MVKKIDGAKVRRRKEAMREVKHMQANTDSAKDMKSMKKRPSGRTFDGVSRPSNDLYRENFNKIFGKKDFYEETQKEKQQLEESYKESRRQTKERIFEK
mgnify:FL=1|jgi:hypothetical protein|tara:strand:- start:1135 stop:1431 length:297 start_codon:yes stop_codon:yes gene_type:complete